MSDINFNNSKFSKKYRVCEAVLGEVGKVIFDKKNPPTPPLIVAFETIFQEKAKRLVSQRT